MKKILFLILFLSNIVYSYSQNYNKEQENLRTEISSYLRKQGLNPEIQNDGLKFLSEGNVYYIEIVQEEVEPMFVRLRRYIKYNQIYDKQKIATKLNEFNSRYGVKVFCKKNTFVLSSEIYVTKASEFNNVFNTYLRQMGIAYKSINK